MRSAFVLLAAIACTVPLSSVHAQGTRVTAATAQPAAPASAVVAAQVRDEVMMQFQVSMRKFIALAEAMPADKFTWKPHDDAMPVGHVYAHVAHYNYYYPATALDITPPAGMQLDTLETVRDKERVIALLRQSLQHVRSSVGAMTGEQLAEPTRLYGRDIAKWAVLVQLVAHMNEHLGQSIAYARSNDIVPPWSR